MKFNLYLMLSAFLTVCALNISPSYAEDTSSKTELLEKTYRNLEHDIKTYREGNKYQLSQIEKALKEALNVKGFDINKAIPNQNNGNTLIHRAATKGSVEILELFLKYAADINVKNAFGKTPLHRVASRDLFHVLKFLVEKGADVNAKTTKGRTPLVIASYERLKSTDKSVRFLIENNADVNLEDHSKNSASQNIVSKGDKDLLVLMLKAGADPNHKDALENTLLQNAIKYKEADIAKHLIDIKEVDLNSKDNKGNNILTNAINQGMEDIVNRIIKSGRVDLTVTNSEGETFIHLLVQKAYKGYGQALSLIAKKEPALINIPDKYGNTPLHDSLNHKYDFDMAKTLINLGADVSKIDKDKNTLLHIIAYLDKASEIKDMIKIISQSGTPMDVNAKNNFQETALELLISREKEASVLEKFIQTFKPEKLKLNMTDSKGNTFLHLAAERGDLNTIKVLLEAGVSPDIRNRKRETYLDVLKLKNPEVFSKLQKSQSSYMDNIINRNKGKAQSASKKGSSVRIK